MVIPVVAGVVRTENGLLLTRRIRGADVGMWEFPGGKLETGESPEQALARELREELGIGVRVGKCLGCIADWRNEKGILLMFLEAFITDGQPQSLDNGGICYVPKDALDTVPLAQNDRRFVSEFLN